MISDITFNSLFFLGKSPSLYIDGNNKKKNYLLFFLSILSYIVIFMTIFYLFHLYFTIKNKPYVTKSERFLFENERNPASYKFMFGLRNQKNEIVDFNRQEISISFKSINTVKVVSCDSDKFKIRSIYDKEILSLSSVCFELNNFISSDTIMIKFKENYFTTKEYLINKYKDLDLLWFYEMEIVDENKISNNEKIMHLIKTFRFIELFNVFESRTIPSISKEDTSKISANNTSNSTAIKRNLENNDLYIFSNLIKYELEFTRKEMINDIGFLWEINDISNSLEITSNYYYLKNLNPYTMNLDEYMTTKNITRISGLSPTNSLTKENSDFNIINTINTRANGNLKELDIFYKPVIEIEISLSNVKRTIKRSPKSFADFFAQISGVYFVIMFLAWLISHWYKEVDYYYNMIIKNFKVEAFEQIYQDYEIKEYLKEINIKSKGTEITKLNFDNYQEDSDWVLTYKSYYDKQVRRNTNINTESEYNSLKNNKIKKNINLRSDENNNYEYSNMQNSTQKNLNQKFNILGNNYGNENEINQIDSNNEFIEDRKFNTNIPNKIIYEEVNDELISSKRNKIENTIQNCHPDNQNSFMIDSNDEDFIKAKGQKKYKNNKLENDKKYNTSFQESKKDFDISISLENKKKNNPNSNYKLGIKKNNLIDDINESEDYEENKENESNNGSD